MEGEEWFGLPADEMSLEQARQAVEDLRKMVANKNKEVQANKKNLIEQELYYKNLSNSYAKTINKLTRALSEHDYCKACNHYQAVKLLQILDKFNTLEG